VETADQPQNRETVERAAQRAAMRAQFEGPYDPAVDPPPDEMEIWAKIRRAAVAGRLSAHRTSH
jgi:hypothetical protein